MYSKLLFFLLIQKIFTDDALLKINDSKKELESMKISFLQQSIYIDEYSPDDILYFTGKLCTQTSLEGLKTNCIEKYKNYNSIWVRLNLTFLDTSSG
jgi:hypothetical protein